MEKKTYIRIILGGILLALAGAVIILGIPSFRDFQTRRKIAEVTPSFRGAKNLDLLKLNRENRGQHFFSLDDFVIKTGHDGRHAYVSDLPVYLKTSKGKIKGFMSYWGYNEKPGNWELIEVGKISERKD